jgi:hypothetical protein
MRHTTGLVVAAMLTAAATSHGALADGSQQDPSAGFPANLVAPCGAGAVRTVPAPFDGYMRLGCLKSGQVLAPKSGYSWVFTNGMSMALSALSTDSPKTGEDAYFTRLENAPLSPTEDAAFRMRVKTVVNDASFAEGDLFRMALETSTGDHRQEYLFVNRDAAGQIRRVWGIECFNDCDPMENPPWGFVVVSDAKPPQKTP